MLLKQGSIDIITDYVKILIFYNRHSELVVKPLMQLDVTETIFYGDSVYKFKRIVGKPKLKDNQTYKNVEYNIGIIQQSACLVVSPVTVYSYAFLFTCMTVGEASDSVTPLS